MDEKRLFAKYAKEYEELLADKRRKLIKLYWKKQLKNLEEVFSPVCQWRNSKTHEKCTEQKKPKSRYCQQHHTYEKNKKKQKEKREELHKINRAQSPTLPKSV